MSTWFNRGASGGLAGALKTEKKSVRPNQSTATHTEIRTPPHRMVLYGEQWRARWGREGAQVTSFAAHMAAHAVARRISVTTIRLTIH